MFRTGVSTTAPEGLRWTSITVPPGCEVNQISVGPTGLVWAVLWNGRALVRAGVTRESPTGNVLYSPSAQFFLKINCNEMRKQLTYCDSLTNLSSYRPLFCYLPL